MRSILHAYRQGQAGTKGGPPDGLDRGRLASIAAIVTRRTRRLLVRPLTLGLALVVAVALVGVWVRVVRTLLQPVDHKPPIGQPSGVVWGDRVFTSSSQLRRFLESRGLSYTRWANTHPYAFTGRTAPAATRQRPITAPRTPKATVHSAAAGAPKHHAASARRILSHVNPGSWFVSRSSLTVLLILAGVVLMAAAAAVRIFATATVPLVPRIASSLYLNAERRATVFAAGLAILVGLLIAYYLI